MDILGFLFDIVHYLIGMIIVCLLVCVIIKVHNYYSRNNIILPTSTPSKGIITNKV